MTRSALVIGPEPAWVRLTVLCLASAAAFVLRIHDVSHHFWLLGDQIRDWNIALHPFHALPLVGPPTHVGGYTVGPAFYWILWAIRVATEPFFTNQPHGGGIAQALLESGADALLVAAVWRRTRSLWLSLATIALLATPPVDLALAAVIWNPVIGATLAKVATAFVLLEWPRRPLVRTGVIAAIAWCAVQSYSGVIFVTAGIFTALAVDRDWASVRRRVAVIAATVVVLQIPYAVYQWRTEFSDSGMSAVTGNVADLATGRTALHLGASASAFVDAFQEIHGLPASSWPWVLVLLVAAGIVAVRYRADPRLLAVTILPPIACIAGYAFWRDDFKVYYYLSLTPAEVLTMVFGLAAVSAALPARAARVFGVAICAGALAIVPGRVTSAATQFRMPEYAPLAAGSRAIFALHQTIQSIGTDFPLPPTSDPEFIYLAMGGRLEPSAPWRAVIHRDGRVEYPRAAAEAR